MGSTNPKQTIEDTSKYIHPRKATMEPKNGGLEDDFTFQERDF